MDLNEFKKVYSQACVASVTRGATRDQLFAEAGRLAVVAAAEPTALLGVMRECWQEASEHADDEPVDTGSLLLL